MVNLSLNDLKTIFKKKTGIKDYKSMYEERLLSVLNESKLVKENGKNFDDARIEKIKKDFNKLRDRLSKSKTKEIRKDLYRIENKKNISIFSTLSIKEYLNLIRPYLRDIINDNKTQGEWKAHSGNEVIDYKTQGEWKIQLTMVTNFISFKDSDEIRTMRTESNNIEIVMGNETVEIIEELFESFMQKYKKGQKKK